MKILEEAVASKSESDLKEKPTLASTGWTQTAFRTNFLGSLIYAMTLFTILGFQILLLLLTMWYYVQQEVTNLEIVFEDDVQVLFLFEVVWMVGFFWCFSLTWPYSVKSLFLRRCTFDQATHVAVFAPLVNSNETEYQVLKWIEIALSTTMNGLFSMMSAPKGVRGKFVYCPVELDSFGNKFFTFRLRRYTFDDKLNLFTPSEMNMDGKTIDDLKEMSAGLSSTEVSQRLSHIGPNIMTMEKPNFLKTLMNESTTPFYLYQLFMMWTWFNYWYYYVGIVTLAVILTGVFTNSFFKHRNQRTLYQLAKVSGEVEVIRDGKQLSVKQKELVPGDIIHLKPGDAYCDMVILSGDPIIVDESCLTGEANPVTKVPLEKESQNAQSYDPTEHKKSTISAGTTLIEVCESRENLGLVTKTGSFTMKGELVRDIMSYERHKFKFDEEVKLVVAILFCYAIAGFSIAVHLLQDQPVYAWFYGMFVIATALPPLLPTVFVVAVGHSDVRLNKNKIACSDTEGILVAGKVRHAFFDKTGTLTKQGLDYVSSRAIDTWDSGDLMKEVPGGLLGTGIAVCHSLVMFNKGSLVGKTVDRIMFQASGAVLEGDTKVTTKSGEVFNLKRRFEFSHYRMTQSVIVENESGKLFAFAKGSAESIKKLCNESSIPSDYDTVMNESARNGMYQIALAAKEVSEIQDDRENVESNLNFVGFINFKNIMREETPAVIEELKGGDIKSTMLTGDNVLVGIRIARESGLIDSTHKILIAEKAQTDGSVTWINGISNEAEFQPTPEDFSSGLSIAMCGDVWSELSLESPDMLVALSPYVRVIGRCTPSQKMDIVTFFIKQGFITLMCGDGGNDCGALKTAHVGVALSDGDASVVAPFTSLDKEITSIPIILKEGRAALASAIASYKYMLMYGQVESLNQLVTAYFYATFSDWSWIFMDAVWLMTMAFTLPMSKPNKVLSSVRPTASILGPHTLASFIGILVINFSFMIIAIALLFAQDWFQCRSIDSLDLADVDSLYDNYEVSVIFIVSGYQYVSSAMAYNFGFFHRESWWRNYLFVICAAGFSIVHFHATLVPSKLSCFFRINCLEENIVPDPLGYVYPISHDYNNTLMPERFRWILFIIMIINTFMILIWEYFIVNGLAKKRAERKYELEVGERKSNLRKSILKEVEDDKDTPL